MYQKILVPIDGSEISTQGLKEAIKLAKNQHSQIRLFHIANDRIVDSGYGDGSYGGQIIECARENGQKVLSGAVTLARQHGLEAETVLVESIGGPAAAMIVTEAREWQADLIVMGTHDAEGCAVWQWAVMRNPLCVIHKCQFFWFTGHQEKPRVRVKR